MVPSLLMMSKCTFGIYFYIYMSENFDVLDIQVFEPPVLIAILEVLCNSRGHGNSASVKSKHLKYKKK